MERSDQPRVAATFFCADEYVAGGHVSLADDAAQHARVLRIGPGEIVELRNGHGSAARGLLARVTKRSLTVDVEKIWNIPQPAEVHMMVPVGDRDRMLLLAEKATELGAASWRPVMWRRSKSVTGRGEGPTFVSKTRARMISALTQSGGGWLPQIHPSASIARAISAAPDCTRVLLDANSDQTLLSLTEREFPMVIALGPEGGLAADERDEMIEAGFIPARIGAAILRFETAGIAGLAIARAMSENRVGESNG
ncbi:MAG TPA: RsmE family RNA methyltransferase [Gemmatimonadaceae bacterium]|nr:RsmE family RNA methyltransferase [Gemmatimonadaceae bacterium]